MDPNSADAGLGLGYALYTLRKYDEALDAWLQTERLRPDDPAVQLSLGALYWRMGSLVEGYVDENGKDKTSKEYCREQFTLDQRTTAETRLKQSVAYWTRALELPGLSDKVRASTYSSLGQIYYLMQSCPNLDEAEMLQKAVESNDVARKLDPTNAAWPYRSGGLANNLFVVLRDETAGPDLEAARWALRAMQDFDRSIALSTVEKFMKVRQDAKRDRLPGARDYARAGLLAGRDALEGGNVDQAMRWFDASLALASRTEMSPLELYGELEGGDMDRAMRWFDVSLALASRTEISPTELYGQLEELEAWLAVHPDTKAEAQRPLGEVAIRKARSQVTVVAAFLDGLAALKSDRIEDATQDYRRGLEEALAQGDLASIAAAAIALRYEDGHNAGPLLNLFARCSPTRGGDVACPGAFRIGRRRRAHGCARCCTG